MHIILAVLQSVITTSPPVYPVIIGDFVHTSPVSLSRTPALSRTHLNRLELHPSGVMLLSDGSFWSQVGGIWSRVFMVGPGGPLGSKLPAMPKLGRNNAMAIAVKTAAANFMPPCFLIIKYLIKYLLLWFLKTIDYL
jgi:hypothetical protein